MPRNVTTKSGFTLIELLVVIAIIAILATLVLVALEGAQGQARDADREGALSQVRNYAQLYYTKERTYDGLDEEGSELHNMEDRDIFSSRYFDEEVVPFRVETEEDEFCAHIHLEVEEKYVCVDNDLELKRGDTCEDLTEGARCVEN